MKRQSISLESPDRSREQTYAAGFTAGALGGFCVLAGVWLAAAASPFAATPGGPEGIRPEVTGLPIAAVATAALAAAAVFVAFPTLGYWLGDGAWHRWRALVCGSLVAAFLAVPALILSGLVAGAVGTPLLAVLLFAACFGGIGLVGIYMRRTLGAAVATPSRPAST